MSLDLDAHRLRDADRWTTTPIRRRFPRSHRLRGKFLRPIPWTWIAPAAQLPGAALRVALLLVWYAGVRRQYTDVHLPAAALREFRVSPRAYYRALRALEAAGLVMVVRRPGCAARVTLMRGHTSEHRGGV